jgi:hypothetical protein
MLLVYITTSKGNYIDSRTIARRAIYSLIYCAKNIIIFIMLEIALCFPNSILREGHFEAPTAIVIGQVLPDGTILGTDYKFEPGTICGGIAMTENHALAVVDDRHLENPATGEVFTLTKKGNAYFDKATGWLVKPYCILGGE